MEENTKITQDSEKIVSKPLHDENGKFAKGHEKLGGRTLGVINYDTEMDEAIEAYAKLNNLTPQEVKLRIYMKGAGEALKGLFPFYKDYMDRRHGQAKSATDITSNGESIQQILVKFINGENDTNSTGV